MRSRIKVVVRNRSSSAHFPHYLSLWEATAARGKLEGVTSIMAVLVVWMATAVLLLGILCVTLPRSATAIELSKLYGHMDGPRYKRSGK